MSAPQDKSTEKLRAPEEEVQETRESENLNENAEEQTKPVQTAVADPQIKNDRPEDEKKSMGEILLVEANKITVEVNFNDKNQQMYDALSKGGDIFKRTEKTILGGLTFSSGKFYFEVDVKGKEFWGVGVAEDYAEKKGYIEVNPENGFWMISRKKGKKFWGVGVAEDYAEKKVCIEVNPKNGFLMISRKEGKKFWGVAEDYAEKKVCIEVNPENGFLKINRKKGKENKIKVYKDKDKHEYVEQPEFDKVGVLVDFDKGLVAFYNVDTSAHIYTFRDNSFHKLRPVIL